MHVGRHERRFRRLNSTSLQFEVRHSPTETETIYNSLEEKIVYKSSVKKKDTTLLEVFFCATIFLPTCTRQVKCSKQIITVFSKHQNIFDKKEVRPWVFFDKKAGDFFSLRAKKKKMFSSIISIQLSYKTFWVSKGFLEHFMSYFFLQTSSLHKLMELETFTSEKTHSDAINHKAARGIWDQI